MKKIYTKVALVLVVFAIIFAILSFLRENWSANESPTKVESFLAKWFLNWSRRGYDGPPNPLQPTEENLQAGRQLYEKQCAFCHGLDGKGSSGVQFYPPVPSLIEHQSELADGQIQSIISKGVRYTGMPSFSKALTTEEIWKVVLWVRQLPHQPPPQQSSRADVKQQR